MNHTLDKRILKTTYIFRFLSDPTRLKILRLLFRSKKILCVGEIAQKVEISHSAASHQLAKLENRGIIQGIRMGQTTCYKIKNSPEAREFKKVIFFVI